jgi:hypothetical protein
MADSQGFEPWIGYKPMPVFKTGAFNRSANCPRMKKYLPPLRVDVNHI